MTAATESSQRFMASEEETRQHVHEETVREMEQIRHTNATMEAAGSDSFRAQTEQAAIKIVTPFYKLGEKPSAEVRLGSSVADLSARFAETEGDYKAERSAEHFRMQIIEPKVVSHAHIPAHAVRDYARRHLITDFPSLHGKRSFIDLEAIEQRKLRAQRKLPEAGDRDRDLDKFLKAREDKEAWKTPWPAPKPEDESLRELDRLRQNIDHLQRARPIPKAERAIVKVEPPPPLPARREIVEVRREVVRAPAIKHTVHRVEEKKRTEEVERRILRKERRHKSRRMHRSHHSSSAAAGGAEYQYGSWGSRGGGGYRSSSASRASRGAYLNGYHAGMMEHHLPIAYEGGGARSRSGFDSSAASDRYYGERGVQQQQNGFAHARYGSLASERRGGGGEYMPNGELRMNGTGGGGSGNVKAHRVHKAHSTRDVFYRGEGGGAGADSHYSTFQRRAEPFVEFPPTLDRRSEHWGPEPPPHRRHMDEYSGGGARAMHKARSYADWEEGARGAFGHSMNNRYDEDMARLENEFRDARLMRIPGNLDEKEQYHREIPGGYEAYSRETKGHADHRKLHDDDGGHHYPAPPPPPAGDFRRESQRP